MEDPSRMIGEPLLDLGMLVGGVVVGDGMDDLAGPDSALDGVEELDELLVGMARHAAADDRPVEDVEGGEQGGCAVALIIVGHGAAFAGFIGRPGWVRSSAWICDFSSIETTTAWAGGFI